MAAVVWLFIVFISLTTNVLTYTIQGLTDTDYISYESNIEPQRKNGTDNSAERLTAVQNVLKANRVDAYIVPSTNAHNTISPTDARREWLSGLQGSSGTVVVTATESIARVWTDSRYFTQFEQQVNTSVFTLMKQGIDPSVESWLVDNMLPQSVVAVDPTTYTRASWTVLEAALKAVNVTLRAIPINLVDVARDDIEDPPPPRNFGTLISMPFRFSGRRANAKLEQLMTQMSDRGVSALVLAALDEIAYTLNIRGIGAIPNNPGFFSYLVLRTDLQGVNRVNLFWSNGTTPDNISQHLEEENVQFTMRAYDDIFTYLRQMSDDLPSGSTVWLSQDTSHAIYLAIETKPTTNILSTLSPVALVKCVKNDVELEGFRSAHIKDGIAVVRGLRWVEEQVANGVAVTEMDISNTLLEFRAQENDSYGPSFSTIAGAGENGAIIHYRPPEVGSRVITKEDMLLVDSGGHYMDGTTDITRTRHMSASPTPEQKFTFTRVLKGQIALGTTVFGRGTRGHTLDAFARKHLWDVGLNYAHGTGHGIGHFLNVHEGPSMILSGPLADDPGIVPGMIFSNEPGYYEVGQYGIRHEDVVEVIALDSQSDHMLASGLVGNFSGAGALGFHYISLVPQQAACIDVDLLTDFELEFLNKYHKRVLATLGPILKDRHLDEDYDWLEKECAPILRSAAILYKASPFLLLCLFSLWFTS
ncbi:hypothetical protein ACJJTC_015216 [Scirpophaga incertulas]